MLMKATFVSVLLGGFTLAATLHGQVPHTLSYQGHLAVNGNGFNGPGQFKFALVDSAGTTTFWSNDGTSAGGAAPTDAVTLTVNHGLYAVLLGDTNLANMTAIPYSVFGHPDVHLRIWFNDGQNGFQLFAPDQIISSVGYAMMSADVPDGSITAVKIAPNSVDATHIANNAVSATELADGSVTTPKLADGAVTAAKIAPNAIDSSQIVNNSVSSADVADVLTLNQLNLGGLSWDGLLNLYAKPGGGGGGIINPSGDWRGFVQADAFGSEMDLFFSNGKTGAVLSARSPGGRLRLWDATGSLTTILGTLDGGGDLNLYQINGNRGIVLNGDRATYDNLTSAGGEIEVRTSGDAIGLLLDGEHDNAGRIEVRQPNTLPYVDIFGRGQGDGGEIRVKDTAGNTTTVELLGAETSSTGGKITVRESDNTETIVLDGEYNGPDGGARVVLSTGDGTSTVGISAGGGDATLSGGGILRLGPLDGANVVFDGNEILARNNAANAPLYLNASGGPVVIGTTQGATGYELSVDGQVICSELVVQEPGDWPDYVFAEGYELMPLNELETSIKENRHLPRIPSAAAVRQGGVSMGEMQARLLEKVEELTLYLLEQNRRIESQEAELAALRARLDR